ncbi:MAG: hypothetical protein ACI4WH_05545 [Oscillospiraceae bacterium]
MEKLTIIINKNSHIVYEQSKDYDNWSYDGKSVIIEKGGRLIAVYSISNIISASTAIEKE